MLKIQFTDKRQDPVWVVEKLFTIGSAANNSLIIADESVSDQHARLVQESQRVLLQDLGSRQGSFVNGQRITQRQVGCGDIIRIGGVDIAILDPIAHTAGLDTQTDASEPGYWALIADTSWLAGQEFPLFLTNEHSALVGRGNHCDVVFPGTHLSREHARLRLSGNTIQVTDLSSANGTYINDQRVVGEATANAGDRIRLDIYSFTLLGPGISLPQSARLRTSKANASTAPHQQSNQPKRWKTRPTSPGNREENAANPTSRGIIVASVLLLIALAVSVAYLLLH